MAYLATIGDRAANASARSVIKLLASVVVAFFVALGCGIAQPAVSRGGGPGQISIPSSSAAPGNAPSGSPVDRAGPVLNVVDFGMKPSNGASQNAVAWAAVHARYEALGGSTTIFIPPGNYHLDVSSGPFVLDQLWWKIDADGVVLLPTGGGSVLRCQPNTDKWRGAGGPGEISGLAIYTTANPGSGAMIDIDNCNSVAMHEMRVSGGYRDLRIASSQQFYGQNINLNGDNTSLGSTMVLIERSNTVGYSNRNNAAFTLDNFSAFSSSTYTFGMVIKDADGGYFSNGRVGNTTHDAILIQPGATTEPLDGLQFVNVSADTAGGNTSNVAHGYHFSGLTAYKGHTGSHTILGAGIDLSTGSGIYVDDPSLAGLTIVGAANVLNGRVSGDDITILAGSAISIVSGSAIQANVAGTSTARHIRIGGTASGVLVSGVAFAAGEAHTVRYDIGVESGAGNVVIGPNLHTGATVAPLSIAAGLRNVTVTDVTSNSTLEVSAMSVDGTIKAGATNANGVEIAGSGTGDNVAIRAIGSDNDISINVAPKGGGKLIAAGELEPTPRTPRHSSEKCTTGQFSVDVNFIYVCTANNGWKRTRLSPF